MPKGAVNGEVGLMGDKPEPFGITERMWYL